MAEIFLAQQQGPHGFLREVVVKRMLPHISDDENFVRMFIREAKLMARLVHPNITQLFDFGEEDSHLFVAMEFVDGTDVRALLRAFRVAAQLMPVEIACHIALEVARGLDCAHRLADPASGHPLGLVHRDISPSNVLLSREGGVKLCDFGIAHVGSEACTQVGTLKGKYGYMSPEQATGGSLDARSDIFSLGATFWELLTARRLYGAESALGVLALARSCEPRPLPRTDAPMYSMLSPILDRALARDPARRHGSAADFIAEVTEYVRAANLPVSSSDLATTLKAYCSADLARSHVVRTTAFTSDKGTPGFGVGWQSPADNPRPAVVLPEPAPHPTPRPSPAPPQEAREPAPPAPAPAPRPGLPDPAAAKAARSTSRIDQLLQILLRAGVVDEVRIEEARRAAARSGESVVYALLAMRAVSDSDLAHAFGVLLDIPVVDLASEVVLDAVARHIPAALAIRLSAIPFRLVDREMGRPTLYLAIANPASLGAVPEIEFATGMKVRPFFARQAAVLARIRRAFYNEDLPVPPLSPTPPFRKGDDTKTGG
jgi:serine/threonine protein kinase